MILFLRISANKGKCSSSFEAKRRSHDHRHCERFLTSSHTKKHDFVYHPFEFRTLDHANEMNKSYSQQAVVSDLYQQSRKGNAAELQITINNK